MRNLRKNRSSEDKKSQVLEAMNRPIVIKLKSDYGDLDKVVNEDTMRVIKHEYATRYLENLGVNPTAKNINSLLREKPFSKCHVETGGEGQVDAVEIVKIFPNPDFIKKDAKKELQRRAVRTSEYDTLFDTKLAKFEETYKRAKETNPLQDQGVKEQQDEPPASSAVDGLKQTKNLLDQFLPSIKGDSKIDSGLIDFSFDIIKQKYLSGANLNVAQNQRLRKVTSTGLINVSEGYSVYDFDFNNYRLEKQVIKELQSSFEVHSDEIKKLNELFLRDFPFMRIPIVNINKLAEEKKVSEYLHIYGEDKKRFNEKKYIELQQAHSHATTKFELADIELLRSTLSSEEVIKIQGLLLHLTNWIVFRRMAMVPLDALKRKQMIVLIMNYFVKTENDVKQKIKKRLGIHDSKIWSRLVCPILIVSFKMITEYFYQKKCPNFFKDLRAKEEAFRLIFSLINEIFDPSDLNSKLLCWQESISHTQTKRPTMIKTKMYQVSPSVEFLYSKPADVNTRKILSLNNKLNAKSKGLAMFLKETITGNTQDDTLKVLNLALDKKISQLSLEKIYGSR